MVPKSCTSWGDGQHWYHFLIQDTLKKQVVSSPDESTLNSFSVQLPGQQSLRWVLITPLPRRSSTRLGEADVWWLNSVILTSMRMLKSYKHDWLTSDTRASDPTWAERTSKRDSVSWTRRRRRTTWVERERENYTVPNKVRNQVPDKVHHSNTTKKKVLEESIS